MLHAMMPHSSQATFATCTDTAMHQTTPNGQTASCSPVAQGVHSGKDDGVSVHRRVAGVAAREVLPQEALHDHEGSRGPAGVGRNGGRKQGGRVARTRQYVQGRKENRGGRDELAKSTNLSLATSPISYSRPSPSPSLATHRSSNWPSLISLCWLVTLSPVDCSPITTQWPSWSACLATATSSFTLPAITWEQEGREAGRHGSWQGGQHGGGKARWQG